MRLTLRTMLAYLDDILEPDDTEDISKKIEESEFATELVHRTRDVMRRLRLGVPPLTGRGLASDSNTVAEYLDNTLTADRVSEFEKICLESDVHLAEVASCHQILTLVLGEPAAIDPQSRQRMYHVADEAQQAPPVHSEGVHQPAMSATPPAIQPGRRHKPEVPEYLREERTRIWPMAAAVLIGVGLALAGLFALSPKEWRPGFIAMAPDAVENAEGQSVAQPLVDPAAVQAGAAPEAAAPADNAAEGDTPPVNAPVDPTAPGAAPAGDEPPVADQTAAEPAEAMPDESAETTPEETVPGDTAPAEAMPDDPAAESDFGRAAAGLPGRPSRPLPGTPGETPADPAGDATEPGSEKPIPPDPDATATDEPAEAARDASPSFGRYMSKQDVLLRLDPQTGDWKPMAPMAPLAKGDRLMSLPSFRPLISLSSGINLQLDGAAQIELVGWNNDGTPIVAVEFGRLLMMTVGKGDNSIQLKLDGHEPVLTFVDSDSDLALEARRILPPGADPLKESAPLAVDLYAKSGSIRVRDGDAPVDLQAPVHRALYGGGIEPPGAVPTWVNSEAMSDIERKAANTLEPLLPPDRLIGVILTEQAGARQREVRSLAIRSACYLNMFDPCVKALNEKDEKTLWPVYIEELRAAAARGPESAGLLRAALEKQSGADGTNMFRMLAGYSADDLAAGGAASLVDGLNHDALDHRVLAFWTLQNITGLPNYGYYPSEMQKKRTAAVNTWKERLRQGKIVPKSAAKPKATASRATEKP